MPKFTREDFARASGKFSKAFRAANPDLEAQMAPRNAPRPESRGFSAPKVPIPQKPSLNGKFEELWNAAGGPKLTPEYRFHPERRWRFDFCLPDKMVAIELEGTVYQGNGGRHQTKKGMDADCEKYFLATVIHGWIVVRLTRALITPETVAALLAWDRLKRGG